MANALYDSGRNAFLVGSINWTTDTIKAVLVDAADYTVDLATHDFLDDVPVAARVATVTLSGKTAVGGVADAADATFLAVTGDESEAVVLYKDTGVEATSQLIAYIDTALGLPIIPSGVDILVRWDAQGIFKL